MRYDDYGRPHVSSRELCDMLYKQPDLRLDLFEVDDPETYNSSVASLFADQPKLKKYTEIADMTIQQFDEMNQKRWRMPDSYKDMDIAQWLLDQCKHQHELQRVAQELFMFQDRDMLDLLRFLKYLVDTMRKNGVVWGVGRGSSVASYVLYLIGVHKIDSIYYQLDIEEFLK